MIAKVDVFFLNKLIGSQRSEVFRSKIFCRGVVECERKDFFSR